MKKMLVIFLLFFSNSFAQVDTTALSFYPLNTGNYWEYKESEFDDIYLVEEKYYSITIIGDTLLTNGQYYKILEKQYLKSSEVSYVFERVDSLTGNVYRYYDNYQVNNNEYLIDSLKSQVGDSCTAQRFSLDWLSPLTIFTSEEIDSLLGQKRIIKNFIGSACYISGDDYQLVENIGLYKYSYYGETRAYIHELIYARIESQEYGKKIQDRIEEGTIKPNKIFLKQNYPNPFNNCTTIAYSIELPGMVSLEIFNATGQKIKSCTENHITPGDYTFTFNSQGMPSGIYFITLIMNGFSETRKMLLLR